MEFLLSAFPTIFSWWWVAFYSFQWSCLVATTCSSYQKVVREWIINSLSYAPWTNQGLLQEKLFKANTWQRAQHTPDAASFLSEIRIDTGKNDNWISIRAANVLAVIAAAAAASGANFKLIDAFNLEVLNTRIVSITVCFLEMNKGTNFNLWNRLERTRFIKKWHRRRMWLSSLEHLEM